MVSASVLCDRTQFSNSQLALYLLPLLGEIKKSTTNLLLTKKDIKSTVLSQMMRAEFIDFTL